MIKILEPKVINNLVEYKVIIKNNTYNFFIKYLNYNEKINNNIDGILTMLVPIAICNKLTIESDFPIDETLYNNLKKIPNMYKEYYDKHPYLLGNIIKKEEINLILKVPIIKRKLHENNFGVSAISLGVDSLYSLFKNKDSISHLLYINNLDLSNTVPTIKKKLTYVARKYKKHLILAESNIKKTILSLKLHGTNYGVFTAHTILLGFFYPLNIKNIFFNGTSNTPFLNGESVELTHCFLSNEYNISIPNLTKIEKLKYIIEYDKEILEYLRVCNNNYNGNKINCSDCTKCQRTILYLYILGYYDHIKTFQKPKNVTDYIDFYLENIYNKKDITESGKYIDKNVINIIEKYKK
jgi:hypothetical protein